VSTLRRDGQALYYEEHGTGDPILGIHGSPSAAVFWEEAAEELARLGRCVLYDRRGYHRSAWPQPPTTVDLADQVADAVALLAELGGTPAVVIGRSTGGQIALALALEHPALVRALVLLEPAVFALHPDAQRWATELREEVLASAEADPGSVSRTVFDLALGPDVWAGLPEGAREIFATGGPALLAEIRGRGLDLSAEPFTPAPAALAALPQPTLVLSALDSYDAARAVDDRLVAAIPRARHVVVPGDHLIHPAHPAVLAFVSDVLGGGGPAQESAGAGT
jgi:pimeloyl-ACP methyl ester carboxylesterase